MSRGVPGDAAAVLDRVLALVCRLIVAVVWMDAAGFVDAAWRQLWVAPLLASPHAPWAAMPVHMPGHRAYSRRGLAIAAMCGEFDPDTVLAGLPPACIGVAKATRSGRARAEDSRSAILAQRLPDTDNLRAYRAELLGDDGEAKCDAIVEDIIAVSRATAKARLVWA
jgi:hypothetical protein